MWRTRNPDPAQIRLLKKARERYDLRPLAIHVSYLVNLASADPVIRSKSIEAFRSEMERAEAIGAEFLVVHPGSCRGRSMDEGIAAFVLGLRDAAELYAPKGLTILLENTVGAGGQIGSRLEELRSIRQMTEELTGLRIGYCLDTCHLFAHGFDIARPEGLGSLSREVARTLRWRNVRLIHANDSKGHLGSCVDRHENIGEGHIGLEGFRGILQHPQWRSKPFILETPVRTQGDDRRNLDTLKGLAASSRTTEKRVYSSK
jgi:deoxyribonuclease-4